MWNYTAERFIILRYLSADMITLQIGQCHRGLAELLLPYCLSKLIISRPNTSFAIRIIINVSVCSFRFIRIPMLWVYDHYKYVNFFSAGTVFIRQNLMYKRGPHAERINIIFRLYFIFVCLKIKGLVFVCINPFKPEFKIVIFIHYKPRIAAAILDL